jgi:integrase
VSTRSTRFRHGALFRGHAEGRSLSRADVMGVAGHPASGLSVKLVSELIGHASVAITLDRYGHLFDTDVGHAAATFAAYLERADTDARLRQLDP